MDGHGDSGDNAEIARVLLPDAYARAIADISLDDLAAHGVRGIIVDLDNTLVSYHESAIAPAVVQWVEAALARGFKVAMVSNNFEERVATIGVRLRIPAVASAMKPMPGGFLKALRLLGTQRNNTVVVGDQLFTDVVGAKLVGLRTILTEPISERGFITTRVMRVLERALLRAARMR